MDACGDDAVQCCDMCIGVWRMRAGVHMHVCVSTQNSRPHKRLKARTGLLLV